MGTMTLSRFIINIIRPYWGYLVLMLCTGLAWGMNSALSPYLLKLIIDNVALFQDGRDNLISLVQPYVLLYILLWVFIACAMRFQDWLRLRFIPAIRRDIINKMFAYLNQHSFRFFQNNFAGSLVNKINDMNTGMVTIITTIDDSMGQAFSVLIAVFMLLLVQPIFALILIAWVICFIGAAIYFFKPILNASYYFSLGKTVTVGRLVDCITNIINIRLFSRNSEENKRVADQIDETVAADRKMQWIMLHMRIYWDISIILLMSADILLLIYLYGKHEVTVGDFSFVITLSSQIFFGLWWVASQFVSFAEEVGRCQQALMIMNEPHEITDIEDAKDLIISNGLIEFDNVSFHYGEGNRLFENKNVKILSGQKVGLVGYSGSGKSSFVNLILRLFDVESGAIKIDNQDIKTVTQNSLRENISMIPQDVSLFHRTLIENIRYGCSEASDEAVIEAAKKAHCHEFISELEEGYQSLVGERGIKLSGGQRQRIAIARAILKNAPILILDEATSALDSETEKYIQESLDALMQNKTTIVIAHRLSTLAHLDRILVFKNGHIIEDGDHATLIRLNGHYAKLWNRQAGGFLPENEEKNKG